MYDREYECKIADNDWEACELQGTRFSSGFEEAQVFVPDLGYTYVLPTSSSVRVKGREKPGNLFGEEGVDYAAQFYLP